MTRGCPCLRCRAPGGSSATSSHRADERPPPVAFRKTVTPDVVQRSSRSGIRRPLPERSRSATVPVRSALETGGSMLRPSLLGIGLLAAASLSAPDDDVEYTRKIREYTTDPMFLTELVERLPASATVPTPLKFHGYAVGTPDRLTYAKDVHRYFRELERTSPRVKVYPMGMTEENREQILVA